LSRRLVRHSFSDGGRLGGGGCIRGLERSPDVPLSCALSIKFGVLDILFGQVLGQAQIFVSLIRKYPRQRSVSSPSQNLTQSRKDLARHSRNQIVL
jgi:hypothetical protein